MSVKTAWIKTVLRAAMRPGGVTHQKLLLARAIAPGGENDDVGNMPHVGRRVCHDFEGIKAATQSSIMMLPNRPHCDTISDMGKAIRTRRLSIISIISVALFLILAVGGIWSFRATDGWVFSNYRPLIVLDGGCIVYEQIFTNGEYGPLVLHKVSEITPDNHHVVRSLRGFSVKKIILGRIPRQVPAGSEVVEVEVPIWPWLLLLLIAPLRWLRAQPANTPGFPMITNKEPRKI